jgi:hypothetical protein
MTGDHTSARIEPWGDGDLPLLERLLGDPAMMAHLGGPESPERIAERQAEYRQPGCTGSSTPSNVLLQAARLPASGGLRLRLPARQPDALQRLAARPGRRLG